MGPVRKRILPEEEKQMWEWIYKNLKEENKDAYLSCGLQIWNQYIEHYGITDRTADSYATRFRKVMKPEIITCDLKPSEIDFIIKKCKWNLHPSQQKLLDRMLIGEKAVEDGDISGYIVEEEIPKVVVPKKEKDVNVSILSSQNTPTTSKIKEEAMDDKESVLPRSSRPSRKCNSQIPNYNEKFLSRRSYGSIASPALFINSPNASITNTPNKVLDNDNNAEETIQKSPKRSQKRRALISEVQEPVKKRIISDTNDTPKSIFVPVKQETVEDVKLETTVAAKDISSKTDDSIPSIDNIMSTVSEAHEPVANIMQKDTVEAQDVPSKANTVIDNNISSASKAQEPVKEIIQEDTVTTDDVSSKIRDCSPKIDSIISSVSEATTPNIAGGWDPMDDESSKSSGNNSVDVKEILDKENIPYMETPKSIFNSSKEISKESNLLESIDTSTNVVEDVGLKNNNIVHENPPSTTSESNDSVSGDKTTPLKIQVPSTAEGNPSLLTPKSILYSGQRKSNDDGSAMRVRFQSPEKGTVEQNLTPKRTNISLLSTTPSTKPELGEIDADILQFLWHKVHGPDVNDLSAADLVAFQKVSLIKDLNMRINNVQSFFRGRKATPKQASS